MSEPDQVNILLVDDQPAKLLSYEVILEELGEHLLKARSGREALETLLKNEVAVILVDVTEDDGIKRKKVISSLGEIETRFLTVGIKGTREFHQGLFWMRVNKNLDKLDLEPGVRASIETTITETVPKPTREWALWGVTCIPQFD